MKKINVRNQATSLRVLFALFLITHAELTPPRPPDKDVSEVVRVRN